MMTFLGPVLIVALLAQGPAVRQLTGEVVDHRANRWLTPGLCFTLLRRYTVQAIRSKWKRRPTRGQV